MRKMFPKYKRNIIADKEAKTIIHIAEKLYKEGFTDLIMVAGGDRVKEFDTLLQRYNGKPDRKGKIIYDFNSLKVVNAGQRDPDAEGVTGMSASKMRKPLQIVTLIRLKWAYQIQLKIQRKRNYILMFANTWVFVNAVIWVR